MPEPLDSIQPVNFERVPESRPTRQTRDDHEDFYPHLKRRQKQDKDKEENQKENSKTQQPDTYEHETNENEIKQSKHKLENQAKVAKKDNVEGPGFVLDIKV